MSLPPIPPYSTQAEVRLRVALEKAQLSQDFARRLERLLADVITITEDLGNEVTDTYLYWKETQDGKSSPNTNG